MRGDGDDISASITELQNVLPGTESIGKFVQELAVQAARLVTGSLSFGITLNFAAGYGASVVAAGLYLLPCSAGIGVLGSLAGRVERRFTSRRALIAGAAASAVACGWLTVSSRHPYDMLVSSTLLGIGIGLAFAALGNLIVQAVPAQQTGVASGMNTVLRTLGGALGGQIAATFVVGSTVHGLPTLAGFSETFAMAALFLACCVIAGLLIPVPARAASPPTATATPAPTARPDPSLSECS